KLYGLNATLNVHPHIWKAFGFNNSLSIVYGDNLTPKYKNTGDEGQYLPFIPSPRLLSSIDYTISTQSKCFKSFSFNAEGDFNAAQNRYEGLNNTEAPTAGYALMNLSGHTDINYSKKQPLSFQLSINNVFNTAYQNHLSRLQYFEYYTQSPNGHSGIYNMGRNICVKAIVPF
ncbi:MAG TPA: TonB-dependent receptor, partial [Ginsengibacter sp.]